MRLSITLAALALTLAACTDPISGTIPITIVSVTMRSQRVELRTVDSVARFDRVRAQFKDSTFLSEPIPVAGVSFNGVSLPLLDSTAGMYGLDSARIGTLLPGYQQVFRVMEGLGFPALADSVQFPVEMVASAPSAGTTLSKRNGIPLVWTPAVDGDSRIEVGVGTTPDPQEKFSGHSTPDDGSHTFEPRLLATMPPGRIYVFIARVRHKAGKTTDKRNYWVDAESVTVVEAQLVE